MPCFHPLQGFFLVEANGTRTFKFSNINARLFKQGKSPIGDNNVSIPCGKCVGCRLERSRQWALRCMHEASLHERNCFLTLTYSDEYLPPDRSLNVSHFQLFFKRLRKKYGDGIRFYHCGEYGDQLGRPHYHACVFNFDFPDKVFYKMSNGERLFTSESLSTLWGFGFCTIGALTFESAAYVARYCMKKVNGDMADDHYCVVDPDSGRVFKVKPEYATMSRRPGIGRGWYEKYSSDAYPSDYLVVNGVKCKPPRYYDRCFEVDDPDGFSALKQKREDFAKLADDNSSDRLLVKEKIQLARAGKLIRSIEGAVV